MIISRVSKEKISKGDFITVKKAAEEVGIHVNTLKRWLKNKKKTKDITWGRDSRKWIYVKETDIPKLKDIKNSIDIENEGNE